MTASTLISIVYLEDRRDWSPAAGFGLQNERSVCWDEKMERQVHRYDRVMRTWPLFVNIRVHKIKSLQPFFPPLNN